MPNALHDTFLKLIDFYEKNARIAWRPQFSRQPEAFEPQASKYGGRPWLPDDVAWPLSTSKTPLVFVMQLNAGTAPDIGKHYPNSMVLLFAVSMDDSDYGEALDAKYLDLEASDPTFLTMVVPLDATGSQRDVPDGALQPPAELHIVDKWEQFTDHPSSFNLDAMAENETGQLDVFDDDEIKELHSGLLDYIGGPTSFQSTITAEDWQAWKGYVHAFARDELDLPDASSFIERASAATNEAHGKIGGWGFTGPSGGQPAIAATCVPLYLLDWDDDPRMDTSVAPRGTGFLVHRDGKTTPDFIYSY